MKKILSLLLLSFSLLNISCFDDLDDNISQASTLEIQDFIYRGLNFFYLYKADTPELANDAFATDQEKDSFLNSFASPEALFDYLISPQDRFSILVDDYIELENSLSGVTLNNGMEFGLVLYPDDSGDVFGYVRYVLPGTDAAMKGVTRGMIFNTVDGIQLDDTNFTELLDPESYTIGLATFDGTSITPTGETIDLVKEVVTENPIFVNKTFDISGQKIGYIMYNGFTNEFDSQLNDVFGQFRSEGVTDLVLDLRYNGGGSVRTATYLASMITGQFTGQTYYTEEWNADRQDAYAENGAFVDSFVDGGEAINSLNLTRLYVITTGRTASASELVINGLDPYINVVQVGSDTRGKFQASFLLYDAPAPNFSRRDANPSHRYAMLPLVFKTANASGFTDFNDGLTAEVEQFEDYSNLGILGEPDEPLLQRALSEITGIPIPGGRRWIPELEVISESKASQPAYQIMYLSND
ncbi:S41 family peptidase [Altibacter sp. HG106]|uniref:S41 family peptidase n=1 Tax=Altibacter sp. HG106 TaxID=3023937 RepID=UPI0023501AC6|nr:S41 family peptidase [Altibacter sp. HG106]MDC7993751.1 S41 family peptidase [Altibacter sp. HG106]